MNLFKQKFVKVPHLSILDCINETSRNPFVDWIWILITTCVIIVGFIYSSIILYERVVSGDIQSSDVGNTTSVKIFDQKELKVITDKFNNKEIIRLQIIKTYNGPSNPAI
jgi:hypothetical protein